MAGVQLAAAGHRHRRFNSATWVFRLQLVVSKATDLDLNLPLCISNEATCHCQVRIKPANYRNLYGIKVL